MDKFEVRMICCVMPMAVTIIQCDPLILILDNVLHGSSITFSVFSPIIKLIAVHASRSILLSFVSDALQSRLIFVSITPFGLSWKIVENNERKWCGI